MGKVFRLAARGVASRGAGLSCLRRGKYPPRSKSRRAGGQALRYLVSSYINREGFYAGQSKQELSGRSIRIEEGTFHGSNDRGWRRHPALRDR